MRECSSAGGKFLEGDDACVEPQHTSATRTGRHCPCPLPHRFEHYLSGRPEQQIPMCLWEGVARGAGAGSWRFGQRSQHLTRCPDTCAGDESLFSRTHETSVQHGNEPAPETGGIPGQVSQVCDWLVARCSNRLHQDENLRELDLTTHCNLSSWPALPVT